MAYRKRSRLRHGNDGGGFPLGQILALSLGGGEVNPEFDAARAVQADGGQGPLTASQDKALKVGPYRPNNIFQKFYGMDEGDQANRDYRLGRIESEDKIQRELSAIPQRSKAETAAKLEADAALRKAMVARLAPTLSRAGLLPPTPLGDLAATEDFLNLHGIQAGESGALPAFGAGETALSTGLQAQYARPGLKTQTLSRQGADIAESRLKRTAARQETSARKKFPGEAEKGLRGQFLQPSFRSVGGVDRDITQPQTWFAATPETRGGMDPLTGQMMEAQAPSLVQHTPDGYIRPKKQVQPAVPSAATPTAPAPQAGAPEFIGSMPMVPSTSGRGGALGYGPQPESLDRLRKWLEEQAGKALNALPTNQYPVGPKF